MRHLSSLRFRTWAAGVHLLISLGLAAMTAVVVFGLWFPGDYRLIAGGGELFLLLTGVDVILGPVLTFTVFNLNKARVQLRRDLSVIGAIQLAALAYGIHVVSQARPVLLVFEADRFRVVTANEVDREKLVDAPAALRSLSLSGPRIIGVRVPKSGDIDFLESLDSALAGNEVSYRPAFWRSYDEQRSAVLRVGKPVSDLRRKHPSQTDAIAAAVSQAGVPEDKLRYLPVQARRGADWVAFVETGRADVVAFAPLDGF